MVDYFLVSEIGDLSELIQNYQRDPQTHFGSIRYQSEPSDVVIAQIPYSTNQKLIEH